MTIGTDPQALGLHFTTLFTLIGGGLSVAWLMWGASLFGLTPRATYGIALKTVFWALLGARLLHVIDYAGFYWDVPFQAFYLWNGGLSSWGAILVGGAGALWHAKRARAEVGRFADRAVIAALVTVAFGRLGAFLAGERIGTVTSLPWAATYTDPRAVAFGAGAMHPVALYEMLLAGMLLAAMWRWRRRIPQGSAAMPALSAYAVVRLVFGFVTVERTHVGLDLAQWVAIAVLVAIAGRLLRAKGRLPVPFRRHPLSPSG